MMRTVRDAILLGTKAAASLHDQLGVRRAVTESAGGIDVFGALLKTDAVLLFRPLEGLLGACLGGDSVGVIISTQRPLRIQRFTGAHELGHVVLGHQASLDGQEIIGRAPTAKGLDLQEVAADAFAAEFLVPKWLIHLHARRQGWGRDSIKNPVVVYQLALRVGASYDATCRALARDNAIDPDTLKSLLSVPRRKIKEKLADRIQVENWHRDIWLLTERDEGSAIEGQPEDIFIIRLKESAGAGFLWNANDLINSGFAILRDRRDIPSQEDAVGAASVRDLTAQHPEPGSGEVNLEMRRPWQKNSDPAAKLHLLYELYGREVGLPRAVRRQLMAAAE